MSPLPSRPLVLLCLAAALSAGCATHQLRLRPMAGVPPDEAALLEQGRFNVTPDHLFDAAATTLEHEPYFHWDISRLDKSDGFIKASAGLFREVQLRISPATDVDGGTTATAYEAPEALRPRSRVVSADVTLDDLYFYSFTWHVLHDHAQVPFQLLAYNSQDPAAGGGR